jgi:hypothetical protein
MFADAPIYDKHTKEKCRFLKFLLQYQKKIKTAHRKCNAHFFLPRLGEVGVFCCVCSVYNTHANGTFSRLPRGVALAAPLLQCVSALLCASNALARPYKISSRHKHPTVQSAPTLSYTS